jgi:hypothetical protein
MAPSIKQPGPQSCSLDKSGGVNNLYLFKAFMVHLKVMSVAQSTYCQGVGLVNKGFKKTWKKAHMS